MSDIFEIRGVLFEQKEQKVTPLSCLLVSIPLLPKPISEVTSSTIYEQVSEVKNNLLLQQDV